MLQPKFLYTTFVLLALTACRDGNENKTDNSNETVKIGKQNWMLKNLNVSIFRNGDTIPEAKSSGAWTKSCEEGKPAWCYYNNDPKDWKKYGKIYNWYAVKDIRGLAPKGMHLPSDDEWDILIDFFGGEDNSAHKLKSKKGWEENCNGTNESGFDALPGGGCGEHQNFFMLGDLGGFWWSSTEKDDKSVWYRYMSCGDDEKEKIIRAYYDKNGGMRVRCIKD